MLPHAILLLLMLRACLAVEDCAFDPIGNLKSHKEQSNSIELYCSEVIGIRGLESQMFVGERRMQKASCIPGQGWRDDKGQPISTTDSSQPLQWKCKVVKPGNNGGVSMTIGGADYVHIQINNSCLADNSNGRQGKEVICQDYVKKCYKGTALSCTEDDDGTLITGDCFVLKNVCRYSKPAPAAPCQLIHPTYGDLPTNCDAVRAFNAKLAGGGGKVPPSTTTAAAKKCDNSGREYAGTHLDCVDDGRKMVLSGKCFGPIALNSPTPNKCDRMNIHSHGSSARDCVLNVNNWAIPSTGCDAVRAFNEANRLKEGKEKEIDNQTTTPKEENKKERCKYDGGPVECVDNGHELVIKDTCNSITSAMKCTPTHTSCNNNVILDGWKIPQSVMTDCDAVHAFIARQAGGGGKVPPSTTTATTVTSPRSPVIPARTKITPDTPKSATATTTLAPPLTAPEKNSDDSKSAAQTVSTATIAGCSIGGILLLLVITSVVIFFLLKKRQNEDESETKQGETTNNDEEV